MEYLVEYPFNQEVAHMDPEQFVAEILVGKMGAKAIVSGPDCHFGYQRKGDAELLRKLAPKYGYEVSIVEKAMDGEREISSTYIREELAKGNIRKANELLGYEYRISGQVGTRGAFRLHPRVSDGEYPAGNPETSSGVRGISLPDGD